MSDFSSQKLSLKEVVSKGYEFNIPIYQRLYVWEDSQIKIFLEDILNAYRNNKLEYFIGGIVFVKENDFFDLIDGQQRSTTLWLLSKVLGYDLNDYAFVNKNKLRLNFSIRKNVTRYFEGLSNLKQLKNPTLESDKDLINISKAYHQIIGFIEDEGNKINKQKFAEYIYCKVKLICTEVPAETDLTKLFEVINARGVQLEQAEILKAQLLGVVQKSREYKSKTYRLSQIWDACADMNGHVATNLKGIIEDDYSWKELLKKKSIEDDVKGEGITGKSFHPDFLKYFLDRLPNEIRSSQNKNTNLLAILKSKSEIIVPSQTKKKTNSQFSSIISFPMFLLHALRIYLQRGNEDDIEFFNEKRLLEIFNKSFSKKKTANAVIEFISSVWEIRMLFDKYVVKWVVADNEKELKILKLYFSKSGENEYPNLTPQDNIDGFTLLQAMLYHSQEMITQYWLTPFLNFMHQNDNRVKIESYLKKLDNKLFSSDLKAGDLRVRTRFLMDNFSNEIYNSFNRKRFKIGPNNGVGVKFPHYWFYKLEYVLWYQYNDQIDFLNTLRKNGTLKLKYENIVDFSLWESFKITAKNSVEHISPQNPEISNDKLCINMLNHFGNLALVTRGINSSYSNYAFDVKKSKFIDNKKTRLDALKLDLIYSNWNEETWNDESAKEHQEDMVNLLEFYFNQNI